jgi:hypothetical protein
MQQTAQKSGHLINLRLSHRNGENTEIAMRTNFLSEIGNVDGNEGWLTCFAKQGRDGVIFYK